MIHCAGASCNGLGKNVRGNKHISSVGNGTQHTKEPGHSSSHTAPYPTPPPSFLLFVFFTFTFMPYMRAHT